MNSKRLTTFHRRSSLALAIGLSALLGCGVATEPLSGGIESGGIESGHVTPSDPEQSELLSALPTEALQGVDLPMAASKPGTKTGALVGATSEMWAHTAEGAWRLNLGMGLLLHPIQHVVNTVEPVFTGAKKAVWYGSTPLDPQEHLLVVKKVMGHYRFSVLARLKSQSGNPAAWRLRVVGRTFPSEPGHSGYVWVNLNTDLNPETTGKVLAYWDKAGHERTITAFFFNWSDGSDEPLDHVAHYAQYADLSGVLVHAVHDYDLHQGEPGKEALEDAALISRWDASGAGRADLLATGGDVAAQGLEGAAITQCWSAMTYQSVFEAVTIKWPEHDAQTIQATGNYSACAFGELEDGAGLPELGAPPEVEDGDVPSEANLL